MDQRITERLKTLKTDLSDRQLQNIKSRCKSAQRKIQDVKKTAETYSSERNKKVDNILTNLDELNGSLRSAGKDTSLIDAEAQKISQTKEKIDSTYNNYLLAMSDAADIDCQDSPEGFRLSLDDAKQQFASLTELRRSLNGLIKNDLKQALVNLKGSL